MRSRVFVIYAEDNSMALPAVRDNADENEGLFDDLDLGADFGRPDSLRFKILNTTLTENYDEAIATLKRYLDGESEYPNFKDRSYRYVNHAIDLIYAIRAKRNFPGINSLTRAKQQELLEKFKDHLKELKEVLKKIENIEGDLRVADARSTIYVIKAIWWAAVAIITMAFILDFTGGIAPTAYIVIDDLANKFVSWLWSLF